MLTRDDIDVLVDDGSETAVDEIDYSLISPLFDEKLAENRRNNPVSCLCSVCGSCETSCTACHSAGCRCNNICG